MLFFISHVYSSPDEGCVCMCVRARVTTNSGADSCNFLVPTGSLATDNAGFYFSWSQTETCDGRENTTNIGHKGKPERKKKIQKNKSIPKQRKWSRWV